MEESLLADVVAAALKAGADAAEAVGAERHALGISVRLGKLEEVEREESRDIGLRVFVGKQQATVSGSDISTEARAKLVARAVAMAKLAPEDPYAGLAEAHAHAGAPHQDLDLFDASEPSPEELEDRARAAEDAARAMPRISNSEGGSASTSRSTWRLVTSNGFSGLHRASGFSVGASVVAGEGDEMESGYDGRSTRWLSDLPAPDVIGAEAGRRAAARLGARKIDSTTAPVIFENRLATSLIGPLIGAISGPSIARGNSFLKDKLGQQVFAKGVRITDDPHKRRGLGSSPFDDEGVANRAWNLIEDGVLTTWLMNTSSARQLGLSTTGHASRGLAGPPGVSTSNLTLEPGQLDQAGLMREAGSGVLITSMFGPSLNGNTGDWSVGCAGFWFENGELAYPVTEITVAGNLIDIYARLVPGADLEIRGSANAPSILVDGLAIAGK
ncbi:TldD/PmbA family protein [Phenylobacterium aquaticum]|uniref:TldD/PmbA family protein n=1 Tax=Phenylobacterium aquaticum TaxID=1763816 RepID=UPI001F5D94BB|nr:TldD/PmbA family protein [Phenylobacterium aquaticum]MCI3134274.1 TldD/PmbA family protein [Phenylobacterium aquaticum]